MPITEPLTSVQQHQQPPSSAPVLAEVPASSTDDEGASDALHHVIPNNTNDTHNTAPTPSSIAKWKIVVAGQLLSFLLACSGAAQATLHLDCHLTAPTFAVMWVYLGLTLCLWVPFCWKQQQQQRRRRGRRRGDTHQQQHSLGEYQTTEADGIMYTNGDRSNSNHNNNDAPTQHQLPLPWTRTATQRRQHHQWQY